MNNITNNSQDKTDTKNDFLATRRCALNLLETVLRRKTPLDIALDSSADFAALEIRDRAFTRMLLSTTIRRLGQIDELINHAQDRPDTLKTETIRDILRLGLTQIFFMNVPDHACVDTCVRLTEEKNMPRQKNFVNALLRRIIREGSKRLSRQDAARLNTPQWLLKLWVEDYGLKDAARIAQANMNEAPLDITVKEPSEIAFWKNELEAKELATGTLRLTNGGNIRNLKGFNDGKWWVQDVAASIPAQLFGDIANLNVIDLCAAPGGKTLQLAAMGANVTAIDRSAKRLKRLEENITRMNLGTNVTVEVSDAQSWSPPGNSDMQPTRILLDAPCSATGTMRRHPDTAYLKSPADIERLSALQNRLLERSAKILPAGGILIYCTCSLQKCEGEHQIANFLKNNSNFERIKIMPDEIGGYEELINKEGDLRILPFHLAQDGGIDGFFVSKLKRVR